MKTISATNAYGQYCIPYDSRHRPAARTVLAGDVWESDTVKLIRSECKGGDVVHAGAYFGDMLPAISMALDSGCSLFAFEPNPENFKAARHTVEMNELGNVKLRMAALSSESGTLCLQTSRNGVELGGGSYIDRNGSCTVKALTIDDVFEKRVSLIHLDVEGHEVEAVKGAIDTIERCSPVLVLENWHHKSPLRNLWFRHRILGSGYSVTERVDDNIVLRRQ